MSEPDIEVRLRPEQWDDLADMFERGMCISDRNKSLADQTRDKVQASNMRGAVVNCRHSGCAMLAPLSKWRTFITTGERLAKHPAEWRALRDITSQLSPACVGREE